eukprot:CAMPEP_0184716622 /NCGR_PEP_ID=MMETSP0314-20130426/6321_1 /TAXON_ID=38298 /ORGANISM="Rhodella maculata, Strain CCMP 736" /LENGTH=243 /DNA_ID=CAMNT_0027180061 /DNA_START=39 /DNA_END=770 /DNA_ORIENTATION=+
MQPAFLAPSLFRSPLSVALVAPVHLQPYNTRPPAPAFPPPGMKTTIFSSPARPTVPSILDPSLLIYSTTGVPAALKEVITAANEGGKPVVVMWMRHYDCPLCMKQARALLKVQMDADFKLLVIGPGTGKQATEFAKEIGLDEKDMLSDPLRKTFAAVGFVKRLAPLSNCSALTKLARKSTEEMKSMPWDNVDSSVEGNNLSEWEMLQLGGTAVVLRGGRVALLHKDDFAGDHVKSKDVFDLCI